MLIQHARLPSSACRRILLPLCSIWRFLPTRSPCLQMSSMQSPDHNPQRVAAADIANTAAADSAPPSAKHQPCIPRLSQKHSAPCHLCGRTGHWMPECALRLQLTQFRRKQKSKGNCHQKKLVSEHSSPLCQDRNEAGSITFCREGKGEGIPKQDLPVSTTQPDLAKPDFTCLECVQPRPILTTFSQTILFQVAAHGTTAFEDFWFPPGICVPGTSR